jgi:hypothetical protein
VNYLETLSLEGLSAAGDYNDGLDGWFGWSVEGIAEDEPVLTLSWRPNSSEPVEFEKKYMLVEITES